MKELHKVEEAVKYIKEITDKDFTAELAIFIGSNTISFEKILEIPFKDIPYFPYMENTTNSKLILGKVNGRNCYILNGCMHLYEGFTPIEIIRPIRIMKGLGVETVILTNYAGAVNSEFEPGEIMMITDHINFGGENPLRGVDAADFGNRFISMDNAYSKRLQDIVRDTAISLEIPLNEGVYIKFYGPSYETPAEVRIARAIGADAIGMGLVYECIAAVQCKMGVIGVSCLANMASGISEHGEDREVIKEVCKSRLAVLVEGLVNKI